MTSVLAKNAGKAFIHRIKIYCLVTTLYEVYPIRYNIAKYSFLISNSFTNNFSVSFRFQSNSSTKCSWPGSDFIRWPTRLSYVGVCVLRMAFNLL